MPHAHPRPRKTSRRSNGRVRHAGSGCQYQARSQGSPLSCTALPEERIEFIHLRIHTGVENLDLSVLLTGSPQSAPSHRSAEKQPTGQSFTTHSRHVTESFSDHTVIENHVKSKPNGQSSLIGVRDHFCAMALRLPKLFATINRACDHYAATQSHQGGSLLTETSTDE